MGIGDLGWAHQCFRLALCIDPNHAEAYNNLGVLELRKGNDEQVYNSQPLLAACTGVLSPPGSHAAVVMLH